MTFRLSKLRLTHWGWLLPIFMFATVMISTHLTTDTYWGDEAVSLRSIGAPPYPSRTLDGIVYEVGVTHWPPVYFLVLDGWGRWVGFSEFATRTLGLLMGVLSVALVYRLGLNMFNVRTGVISAILLGSSVYFIFYAHEVRGYILYVFLTITCIYLYWELVHQSTLSRRTIIYFIIASVVLMYTHYLALFVVIAIGLYHILLARHLQNWKNIFFSFILIGIAYLPWLIIALLSALSVSEWQSGLSPQVIIETILNGFSNSLWFIAVPLLICSVVFCRNQATQMLWFIAIVFTGLCLTVHILSPFIFNVRHVIGVLPIMVIIIAVGLAHIPYYNRLATGAVLVVWVLAGIWLNHDLSYIQTQPGGSTLFPIETMQYTTSIANECVRPTDTIFTQLTGASGWNENIIGYYLASPDNNYNVAMTYSMIPIDIFHTPPDPSLSYEAHFEQLTDNAPHTWAFIAPYAEPASKLEQVSTRLAETYDYCGQIVDNGHLKGYLYQNSPDITCQSEHISTQTLTSCAPNLLIDTIVPSD
jgi:uncharacterized membrane protein